MLFQEGPLGPYSREALFWMKDSCYLLYLPLSLQFGDLTRVCPCLCFFKFILVDFVGILRYLKTLCGYSSNLRQVSLFLFSFLYTLFICLQLMVANEPLKFCFFCFLISVVWT